MLLDPEDFVRQGWLTPAEFSRWRLANAKLGSRWIDRQKWAIIVTAWEGFQAKGTLAQRRASQRFSRDQAWWLDDFTLFAALKQQFRQQPWWTWPKEFQTPTTARRSVDLALSRGRQQQAFAQWLFAEQWHRLRQYARRQGVRLIGDQPLYSTHDSADVWAHRSLFELNRDGHPRVVSGVPPDYYNRHGQRWGSPLYRWPAHRRQDWRWWRDRFRLQLDRFDLVRFDHFRGLVSTWQIPARRKNASRGRWLPTPGSEILRQMRRVKSPLPLVVEDLGDYQPAVDLLRRQFHLPGTRVLLFGWSGLPHNMHHPDFVSTDSFYYTGTHDTNTVLGWWRTEAKPYERDHVRTYLGRPVTKPAADFLQIVFASRAQVAIIPLPDIFSLGRAARMNRPGSQRRNWSWRVAKTLLTPAVARRLRSLARRYDRN